MFIAYVEKIHMANDRVPMKIYATSKFTVFHPKFYTILHKKVHDPIPFGVKMLSEKLTRTLDVIREAEKEGDK